MNIRKLLLATLGLSAFSDADAFKSLPPSIAREATTKLNQYRRTLGASDMQLIEYDFEAQAKLDSIIKAHDPRWLFENYTGPLPPDRQNINGYFISQDLGYPAGFQIGWHDTCKNYGQNCIITNLNFRIAQAKKDCINYSLCDASIAFDRYRSCETIKPWMGSGHPCSYAWVYLPQFATASITKMACAVLEVPGWKPPPGQLNSYWCFTNGVTPDNDKPFQIGAACSDCAPTERCKERLCI